ncbi:MAG: MFS transporter [Ignavibacteriae bacterium]|nr:MAG: MFS transporter [Ignavibacteriota bacterium]
MIDNPHSETNVVGMSEFPQRRNKFFVLFFLYISAYVPAFFFPLVFPIMLRQSGAPLERIGLLGLMTIPVFVKFLWAPYVDKYGNKKFGHYKTWLVTTQLICAAIGSVVAFLSFIDQFWWIMGLGILFAAVLSTQMIAVNGLAVQCLSKEERPRGNSLAGIGMSVGTITGGSMLFLVDRIGYTPTLLLTFVPLIVGSVILLFFKEVDHPVVARKVSVLSSFESFKSADMRRWLLLVNLCIVGDTLIICMVRPMLVDKGLSLDSIGLMLGIIRPVFETVGAITCPFVIKFFSRKTNLVSFNIVNAMILALFILPAMNVTGNNSLYVIFALVGFINSYKFTLIYSIFMDHSRKSFGATDFALQVSVISIGVSLYSVLSGILGSWLGYATLFSISVVLDLMGTLFIGLFYKDPVTESPSEQWSDGVVNAETVG